MDRGTLDKNLLLEAKMGKCNRILFLFFYFLCIYCIHFNGPQCLGHANSCFGKSMYLFDNRTLLAFLCAGHNETH